MLYDDKIQTALKVAVAYVPRLAGLAAVADIRVSSQIKTAGVFPSGRMLISENFAQTLNVRELAFIVAHELLHLFMQTSERMSESGDDSKMVNTAHDFIINETLKSEFSAPVPAGGLDWNDFQLDFQRAGLAQKWKPASRYSLEELVLVLNKLKEKNGGDALKAKKPGLGDLIARAGAQITRDDEDAAPEEEKLPDAITQALKSESDAFSEEDERRMFPDERPAARLARLEKVADAVLRATVAEAALKEAAELDRQWEGARSQARGWSAGNMANAYSLLRGVYQTPWEAALQRWFDGVAPPRRSWARPSRRCGDRSDVVMPGKAREGWTLNIVLDTSGSMTSEMSRVLGAIDQFCQANDVDSVRILQCDTQVTADEHVEVGTLESFVAKGFGGSDMSPAMLKLAEEPDVAAVVVLTDGMIAYPSTPMPYETLWCITERRPPKFPYGTTIAIDPARLN